jgi:hypothetical protein
MCRYALNKKIGKWKATVKNRMKIIPIKTGIRSPISRNPMSRPSTPTISTTTPLVGPTSPGIASVQRTDTSFARHSPYPQRSRTRTSRASSPSTPSKRRGPKTPLFLPGSRDSSATPGDRSSSQTPSISSDASFHTSNGEDVPIVVKDIVVNPVWSSV